MHPEEVDTDVALVGRLLARQFPSWSRLPVAPVPSYGTDHDVYRLGDRLVVRLPRIGWAAGQAEKEARALPALAPRLPLAVPVPLAVGRPDVGYPFPWAVHEWLPGADASTAPFDPDRAAVDLAGFVLALSAVDPAGAPPSPARLADRDADVRRCVGELGTRIDADAVLRMWERCVATPQHEGPGCWVHGDLLPGNILVVDGRLTAVIDWGALAVGDPARDLTPAWTVLSGPASERFLRAVGADDAARDRARGWALSQALIALPYYWETNPGMVRQALRTLDELAVSRHARSARRSRRHSAGR
jgi:aminoglycoside phosphotransferase (APT) family kinase protein